MRAYAGKTVDDILKEVAGENGLLLVLDEVQTIACYGQGGDVFGDKGAAVEGVLTYIHNGTMGASVVLLAGGLGTSRAAFGKLDISRFKGRCVVNLGRLSPDEERAMIFDWLVIDGRVREGDALSRWIRAIAAETDGWPQHIMAYVQPAARAQGQLTDEGWKPCSGRGTCARWATTRGVRGLFSTASAAPLAAVGTVMARRGGLSDDEVIACLAGGGIEGPDELFTRAVWKGILARAPLRHPDPLHTEVDGGDVPSRTGAPDKGYLARKGLRRRHGAVTARIRLWMAAGAWLVSAHVTQP